MANTYKDIVITPNKSSATDDPKIVFSGANASVNTDITLRVYPESNGTLSFEGTAGQLFSITNDLSGSIFSVNDISGIPSIDVQANGYVSIAPFGGNVSIEGSLLFADTVGNKIGIGTASPDSKLDITQTTTGKAGIYVNMPTAAETTAAGITVKGYSPAIELMDKDSIQNWYIGIDDNDSNKLLIGRGYGPGQSVTQAITIDTSDKVGIGTASPAYKLDVSGNVHVSGAGYNVFEGNTTRIYNTGGTAGNNTSELVGLQVYQPTASWDASMTFHVAGDYAVHFGLDGYTNDLFVGGWSMGAVKYKIWHAGNDGTGSGLDADTLDGSHASSFVTSGGALGTPSSGTLTNCTGLPVGGISATGTPSSSTYLRGDGSWQTPPVGPLFSAF